MITQNQFNEKYKAYLEEGFEEQGLSFDIPEATEYLDQQFEGLIKIPGFKYSQIKCKFGTSRFYTTLHKISPVFDAVTYEIEKKLNFWLAAYELMYKKKKEKNE